MLRRTPTAAAQPGQTTAPRAEVLAPALNVRRGPGVRYPVLTILQQGETVDIVGVNESGTWYQVARGGAVIGWISAAPKFVRTTPAAVDAPRVASPPPPVAVTGRFILQPETGGMFYLFEPETGALRPLTTGIDPALSPDGTQVAFTRWGSGEVGALWLYDLATGEERALLGEMFEPKAPAWSPDGTQLVISYQHGGRRNIESHCYTMRSDGTFRKLPRGAYDIRFRGGKLCFKLPPDTHWQLRRVTAATGDFEDLPSETYSYAPTWDPVNVWRVVFGGSTGLQQLDLNRGEYWAFTTDVRDHAPVFSPDGARVAVTYKQDTHWEIYTLRADSGERARLTPSEPLLGEAFNSAAPAWSPDGAQIAFVSDRGGTWAFWVMNADGSNPRPLLPDSVAAALGAVQYHGVDERLISWGR